MQQYSRKKDKEHLVLSTLLCFVARSGKWVLVPCLCWASGLQGSHGFEIYIPLIQPLLSKLPKMAGYMSESALPSVEVCSIIIPKQEIKARKCTDSNTSTRRFATEICELLVRLIQDSMLLLDRHLHGIFMRVAMEASVSHAH